MDPMTAAAILAFVGLIMAMAAAPGLDMHIGFRLVMLLGFSLILPLIVKLLIVVIL